MKTSWESSSKWYNAIVGKEGHYYHQKIIIKNLLRLLELKKGNSLLDLGCGQGVLARAINEEVDYHGLDLSKSLIQSARREARGPNRQFTVADICKPFPLESEQFSHAAIVLALQNVENPEKTFKEIAKHLKRDGRLAIVLNHPCFRIPRQSHWHVDQSKKLQSRKMDSYMSPLKIPIQTHPGKGSRSEQTMSFHYPLSLLSKWLKNAGFVIECMEEWNSDKESSGKCAKMENRARAEFPLFLTIICITK